MPVFEGFGQKQIREYARAVPAGCELASGLTHNRRGRVVGAGREGSVAHFTPMF